MSLTESRNRLRALALEPIRLRPGAHRPAGFATITVEPDQAEHLNRVAIETFTAMSNAGHSFADCLGSVLMTGMHFAHQALAERPKAVSP